MTLKFFLHCFTASSVVSKKSSVHFYSLSIICVSILKICDGESLLTFSESLIILMSNLLDWSSFSVLIPFSFFPFLCFFSLLFLIYFLLILESFMWYTALSTDYVELALWCLLKGTICLTALYQSILFLLSPFLLMIFCLCKTFSLDLKKCWLPFFILVYLIFN